MERQRIGSSASRDRSHRDRRASRRRSLRRKRSSQSPSTYSPPKIGWEIEGYLFDLRTAACLNTPLCLRKAALSPAMRSASNNILYHPHNRFKILRPTYHTTIYCSTI